MDDARRIDDLVNRGLLDQWYAVAKSVQVKPGRPPRRPRGRDRALARRRRRAQVPGGSLPAPRRALSRGEILGDHIACRYHGVTLDGSGKIVRVPAMPDCPLEGRSPVESFPVAEVERRDLRLFRQRPAGRRRWSWSWSCPRNSPARNGRRSCACRRGPAIIATRSTTSPIRCTAPTCTPTPSPWRSAPCRDLVRIEKTARGFIVARVEQQDENFDWTEMVTETAAPYCRLDIPYPPAAGPGGVFRIIGFTTPVDEGNCLVFFWRCARPRGFRARSGASSIARRSRRGIGTCWSRTARCSPACRRTRAGADALPARSRRRPHPPGAGEQGQGAARRRTPWRRARRADETVPPGRSRQAISAMPPTRR